MLGLGPAQDNASSSIIKQKVFVPPITRPSPLIPIMIRGLRRQSPTKHTVLLSHITSSSPSPSPIPCAPASLTPTARHLPHLTMSSRPCSVGTSNPAMSIVAIEASASRTNSARPRAATRLGIRVIRRVSFTRVQRRAIIDATFVE